MRTNGFFSVCRTLVVAAIVGSTGISLPALSAGPAAAPTDASATADTLVKKAIDALKRDAPAEAEQHARKAWGLKQSYDIASNLALAELGVKKYRDAAEHFAYALRYFPSNGKPEHKKLLDISFAKARAEVAEITVHTNVEGAEVWVNGVRAGISPISEALFAEPGTCTVEAKREGYIAATQTVTTQKGGSSEVTLSLEREPAALPSPSASASPTSTAPPSRSIVPAFVLGGVAVVGAAVGAGLIGGSRAEYDKAVGLGDEIRAAGATCKAGDVAFDARCPDVESTANSSNAMKLGGIVSFAIAGAAASGAVLYWLWPSTKQSKSGARLVPVVSDRTGGFLVTGRF